MTVMKRIAILLGTIALLCCCAQRIENVPADHPFIRIEGARHITFRDGHAQIDRIDTALFGPKDFRISPSVAATTSGVRIYFRTDSPHIIPLFERRPDTKWRESTWFYGIYCDGEFIGDISGKNPVIEAPSPGMHEYSLVLPIMNAEYFCGLKLDAGARLKPSREEKGLIYFAIGDSISHGTGQTGHSSRISYPFIVAENHGFRLYNLAVGASQITPAIVEELGGVKASVITILWGYNDWNATKGDLAEISDRYTKLLEGLLEVQPEADIYCIMYGITKNEEPKENYGCTLAEVRAAETEIARRFAATASGSHIKVIDGFPFITLEGLADGCHFKNEGAAIFGEQVSKQID